MASQRYISRNECFNRATRVPFYLRRRLVRYASRSVGDWEESTKGDMIT